MPYNPREALTVALFNAGCEPLGHAYDKADAVISGLKSMGYELVDRQGELQEVASFVEKAALRAVPTWPESRASE